MKSTLTMLFGILIGLALAAGLFLIFGRPRGEPIQLPPIPTQSNLVVHVSGQVARPGLYALPPGSRVAEALVAAGGALPDADITNLNLALLLEDSDAVRVPALGIPVKSGTSKDEPQIIELVDLNHATAAQLETLPGIGPEKAAQIIADRAEHGNFQTAEEIQRVSGIGPVLFQQIKDWIVILP